MPSPIAHSAVGYLIYRFSDRKQLPAQPRKGLYLLLAALFFSLLPDIDFVPGLLFGDISRYHNQGTHSLLAALAAGLAAGLVVKAWKGSFLFGFRLAFVPYALHILMDAFTYGGRGVKLLWPLTSQRFDSPLSLFIGARWSEGLWNVEHLPTLFSELLFTGVIFLAVWVYDRIVSARAPCPET
jgi:inner membrane protein